MGTEIHVSVRTNTLIIGGGIIGVSIASSLTDRDVMIIDSGEPRSGTSIGNAGHVVVSHAQPFAAPGMIAMGAKSLLHADGGFAFSTHLSLQAASWIASFMRNCTRRNVEKFTPGILSLLRTSAELIHSSGVTTTSTPTWEVFTSHRAIVQARVESEHLSHLGIRSLLINRSEALEQEPSLTPKVKAVVALGEDFGLDPRELWQRLRATNPDLVFHSNELATAIAPSKGRYLVTTTSGMQITAENIVIAAGSWSREVGALLGIKVPIIAAKGYSVTVPMRKGTNSLHPMIFADEKTATDPLGDHLRMSARFELTHPNDRSIKEKRIRQLYERAATVLNLPLIPTDLAELSPWTGLRPASADGAPYIGPVPDLPGVYLATGHGLIGTALSLGTADLISRYIGHQAVTPAELALSPRRFIH
jgi:D-amino-acid dehydrogenase